MAHARWTYRLAAAGLTTALVAAGGVAVAGAEPDYAMPFPCGQTWNASTRSDHSPSPNAVDFNRTDDMGDLVVASAPGIVSTVEDLGDASYGRYVVIDHFGGWSSLHAHLSRVLVSPGQHVDLGQPIALLGTSGNSTGSHLHYEQRDLEHRDLHAVFGGVSLKYNSDVTSTNCPSVPVTGDWNGNGVTQLGMFRHGADTGRFLRRLSGADTSPLKYGNAGNVPVTGDWDGDSHTDLGVWSQFRHEFALRSSGGSVETISWGSARDVPVTGNWDGRHGTDVGVWRPRTGAFLLRNGSGAMTVMRLGEPGDIPVTGDWNSDGRTDIGVFDPATRKWTEKTADGSTVDLVFGHKGDLPVTGDWNGDGTTDIGVWRPHSAMFMLRRSATRTVDIAFGRRRH
jgi:hypothetical protein